MPTTGSSTTPRAAIPDQWSPVPCQVAAVPLYRAYGGRGQGPTETTGRVQRVAASRHRPADAGVLSLVVGACG